MKINDIAKPAIESQCADTIAAIGINAAEPRFTYVEHGNSTTFLWMEIDTTLDSVNLTRLESIKRMFKKSGFKVASITLFPIASCHLSFRIVLEF